MPLSTQSITLHPRPKHPISSPSPLINPLPTLLQTPSGLALLELQGTINLPPIQQNQPPSPSTSSPDTNPIPIGRLYFPDHHPESNETAWMKRVYMYVGEHQRLQGEVKKLPRAVAVVRKRRTGMDGVKERDGEGGASEEELEVVDIVKWKVVFSARPEPVGSEE
ncbi:Sister chromatid cohesion protein Ctf8 [Madurella fahalii]|uniref:Sister chromatid cohesion protein Ctf8 n=1 Tax=Madurella fahalii TaxID=1157608 RepID=A0ABQ0G5Y8_9PEZI